MKNITVTKIVVRARSGAVIGHCIQEAIEFAAKKWSSVELHHSSGVYLVKPTRLFDSVEKVEEN